MRDFQKLLKGLRRAGHDVAFTKNGHITVTGTNGERVTLPGTPGEGRALQNCKAQLRRAGLL